MSLPLLTQQLHDPSQPPPASAGTVAEVPLQPNRDNDLAAQRTQPQGTPEVQGRNAFNSERPLGVTPVPEGGVAIGGQPNLPEGHANIGDKIVGKTQKVIGKYTHNPDLHERGELRETGGKAAAEGRARAAHD
ncbi:hypothetical protein J3R83DRAFT_11449 [Lanmaoa asiatica]|nr:hypothetical protein J3R83DRAFT_11449 [Lanmaoa asiatica]